MNEVMSKFGIYICNDKCASAAPKIHNGSSVENVSHQALIPFGSLLFNAFGAPIGSFGNWRKSMPNRKDRHSAMEIIRRYKYC